jgi:hypothetical protein
MRLQPTVAQWDSEYLSFEAFGTCQREMTWNPGMFECGCSVMHEALLLLNVIVDRNHLNILINGNLTLHALSPSR